MKWWGYIIVGMPLVAVVFVLCVLAFGPAFIAARDWFRKAHF